jgi:hypothetical protein
MVVFQIPFSLSNSKRQPILHKYIIDPLSITASAIAIIQVSGVIINTCYDYRSRVKNAGNDTSRIVSRLNGLRMVIETLFSLLEDETEKQTSTLQILANVDGPMSRCRTELEALRKTLEPKEGWRGLNAAVLWPLKESEVNKVLQSINNTSSILQPALAVDQRYVLIFYSDRK